MDVDGPLQVLEWTRQESPQLPLFAANSALLRELAEIDVDSLTPLQAITRLYELAERARGSQP